MADKPKTKKALEVFIIALKAAFTKKSSQITGQNRYFMWISKQYPGFSEIVSLMDSILDIDRPYLENIQAYYNIQKSTIKVDLR